MRQNKSLLLVVIAMGIGGLFVGSVPLSSATQPTLTGAESFDSTDAKAEAAIRAVLDSGAAGWNSGNLDQYLAQYTEDATEMLATGPAGGRSAIEDTMKKGFWKTGKPLQKLRYEHVNVRMLGKDHALVTGQYVLSGADRQDRTGWWTTIWKKTPKGWRMIHDHS